MPNNFMAIDQGLPRFTGEESLEQRVDLLQDYQYQLLEQLRWALAHLDTRNMNMAAMNGWAGEITEPLSARIEDAEGNLTQLSITAQGLQGQISDANGDIAALELTAATLSARISNAEGSVTSLRATAEGLAAQISTQDGKITSLQQTANSLSASVMDLVDGQAAMLYVDAESGFIFSNETGRKVIIDGGQLDADTVIAGQLIGEDVWLLGEDGETVVGNLKMTAADTADYALELIGYGATRLLANTGAMHLRGQGTTGPFITLDYANPNATTMYNKRPICQLGGGALVLAGDEYRSNGAVNRVGSYGYDLPTSGVQGQVYILLES